MRENGTWLNRVYRKVVYPIFDRRSYEGFDARLHQFECLERLTLDRNRDLQWQALRRLLQHAYKTSPFYRSRFDLAGVNPSKIKCPEDLKKIPPLTRDDIRDHLPELTSRLFRPDQLKPAASGGTTNTPVTFVRDPEAIRNKLAVQWRFNIWAGMLPGDKTLHFWGARQDYSEDPSWRWVLYDKHLMRRVWAQTSVFNGDVLEKHRQALNQFRPRVIYGYPEPLAMFCEFIRDSGRSYHSPAVVICTADPLSDQQRQLIQEVFGCPVFDHYGSREFGMVAGECEKHDGLHVNTRAVYFEFEPVEGAEDSSQREILATDLLNYGMPLIRYRINDCTVLGNESCSCGRGYPLIRPVTGRTTDALYLPNGDVLARPILFYRVFKSSPTIKKIQFVQETLWDFRVKYVPGPGFVQSDLGVLRAGLDEFFPPGLNWAFDKVTEIDRERSGKTRFCISHLVKPTANRLDVTGGKSR
jgi:phenylacetate-CoA ligase